MSSKPSQRARVGLVWRLYAVGVVQFLLVVLSASLIGYVMSRLPRWDMQALSARLKPLANDRVALSREINELRADDRVLISIYDDDGRLLISNVEPPLGAPRFGDKWPPLAAPVIPPGNEWPPRADERFGGGPPLPDNYARFLVQGQEGLLVARFERFRLSPWPPILTMVFGLVVLGVGAFLTARWIARPLQHLSRMAVSLGKGDLRVRSAFARNDELGEVARAFDEMAERIQKLLNAEKELLANVAHELRTPLARIRVALEIAGEGNPETARILLAEIAVDLSELEALIDDVLTAARFELAAGVTESANFSLHKEAIAALTIAENSAERFRANHPDRPFKVQLETDSGTLDADAVLLRRVLDNILENAHKYSPDPNSQVTLSVFAQDGRACFSVADQGVGIPPEDLPRVFTAFFRGERSRSRDTGGVGLGLTLARRIVEAHGGRIEANSSVGEGTEFRALIPCLGRESQAS